MSLIKLSPAHLSGSLDFANIAPSKSILHREIICSFLAGQEMPKGTSEDTQATYNALCALRRGAVIDARNSASTLRFLIPLVLHFGGGEFILGESLANRPLGEYACIKGAFFERNDNRLRVSGSINSGEFTMLGNVSSQFVSGLMFTLPLLSGDSTIKLIHQLQSRDYAELTINVLSRYGIDIRQTTQGYFIHGNQSYKRADAAQIEGDISYAANFVVANYLGADIEITGINRESIQPDRRIFDLLQTDVCDVSECPDLFPILCVAACGRYGRTDIVNAGRVRLKESDRISVMVKELTALGARITEHENGVTIFGIGTLSGGNVDSHNDHRVAMALAIAALCICTDAVTIDGAECVNKSVPEFFEHIELLIKKQLAVSTAIFNS